MVNKKNERFYEKHAWIIFFVIGVLVLVGGIPHMFGVNTDPALVEIISGQTIEQLKISNPMYFNLYNFYFSGGGMSDIGFAFFLIILAFFPFRQGQKWSWYALLFVPLFFIGWIFLSLPLPQEAKSLILPPSVMIIVLSLIGLGLPFRKVFPKKF